MAKVGRITVVKGTARASWFTPVAVVLVLAGAVAAFVGIDALGKAMPNTTLGYGGIGALAAAIVITALLAALTKQELQVDKRGLEQKLGFGKPTKIRWSEPHDYYYRAVSGASTPTVEKASVRTPDGRVIDVDEINVPDHPNARVPGLVEQYSTAANWPKIKEQLDDGEDVDFGAVRLDSDRIEIGDVTQPVKEGIVLQIERGLLRVGTEGKWRSTQVSIRDVANYPCLLRAIGQISQALPPS